MLLVIKLTRNQFHFPLMLAGRAVVVAGAVGGGAALDALVAAGAVAVLLRG